MFEFTFGFNIRSCHISKTSPKQSSSEFPTWGADTSSAPCTCPPGPEVALAAFQPPAQRLSLEFGCFVGKSGFPEKSFGWKTSATVSSRLGLFEMGFPRTIAAALHNKWMLKWWGNKNKLSRGKQSKLRRIRSLVGKSEETPADCASRLWQLGLNELPVDTSRCLQPNYGNDCLAKNGPWVMTLFRAKLKRNVLMIWLDRLLMAAGCNLRNLAEY